MDSPSSDSEDIQSTQPKLAGLHELKVAIGARSLIDQSIHEVATVLLVNSPSGPEGRPDPSGNSDDVTTSIKNADPRASELIIKTVELFSDPLVDSKSQDERVQTAAEVIDLFNKTGTNLSGFDSLLPQRKSSLNTEDEIMTQIVALHGILEGAFSELASKFRIRINIDNVDSENLVKSLSAAIIIAVVRAAEVAQAFPYPKIVARAVKIQK